MLRMTIKGHNPLAEVTYECVGYGCYEGQAIEAKGSGNHAHVWRFIWTSKGLRKPTELESYLFRSKQ